MEIKNVYDDEYNSIEFKVDDKIDVDLLKLYKIYLTGVSSEAGTYKYKLIVCSKSHPDKKNTIDFTVTITGSSSGSQVAVPKITKQPAAGKDYYKADEEIGALSVVASVSSGTLSYQWYKDGNIIENATNDTYTPTEKGEYYVIVSNGSGSDKKSVKSDVVSIVVLAEGELPPPTITTNLAEDVSYDKSSKIEQIEVVATASEGDVHAAWYCDGVVVVADIKADDKGVISYAPSKFGAYYCKLWAEKDGNKSQTITSKTITIKESEISIIINGLDKEAYLGDTLKVSVETNVDIDSISYQWIKASGNVSSSNDDPITGETFDSYTPTEEGYYTCRVTVKSKGGIEKSSVNGGVCYVKQREEGDAKKPEISTPPKDVSCEVGETITLTVVVETPADGGELSYQWKKDGQAISGATNATYTKTDATTEDGGSYTVDVTNKLSTGKSATTTSSAAKVTVIAKDGSIGGGFDFN